MNISSPLTASMDDLNHYMSNQDMTHHSQEEAKVDLSRKNDYSAKRSYVNHDIERKYQLVQVIEEQGITIKEAAAQLDINYSTAKHIMKLYKETGHIKSRVITKKKYVPRSSAKFRTIRKRSC
jgi:transposase-like protein